jgi:DNA polymerase III subunit gamma/tau
MEKFIVSARKYRPQVFNTVVGQSHITTTLKNAIQNNQLAHAFLFCGPRGVGKTTCARILAKTINCESKTADGEACDVCNSCTSFNDGTSMNIHELDAASNNSVDDIRTLVEQVRFAPQAGAYKVYIIDEVHMLTQQAFNAFLKTLEEPPAYAIFILATTEKHKILPTILSRCQIFDFKRITTKDTVEHLDEICTKENIRAEKAALQVISQKSEGCMRDALSIMDKIVSFTNGELNYKNTLEHLNVLDEDHFFKLLDCFSSQNLPDALLQYDEINKKGFEGDTVLLGLAEFIRNILVCKDERASQLLESIESFRKKYIETAKEIDASWLISALNILNEAELNYKQARNKKLHVEMALIKLCYLQQALEVAIGGGGATQYKKTVAKGPVAYRTRSIKGLTSLVNQQPASNEAKVFIETTTVTEPPKTVLPKLLKQEEDVVIKPTGKISLTALKNARDLATKNRPNAANKVVKILNETELKEVWLATAQEVNSDGKNASVSTVFDLAQLTLLSENSFEIAVGSNVNAKVVEQYKNMVMQNLQTHFNNKTISFNIRVIESLNPLPDQPKTLSSKEVYLQMIQQYPLIKELKDRLGLELDY